MMNKDTYIEIAGKISDGSASEQEIALYNTYYNAYQLKYPLWNELTELQKKEILNETEKEIHRQLGHVVDKRTVRLWPRIAVAAAAVAAIAFGIYFFTTNRHLDDRRDLLNAAVNDIAPGKNGATITLANGKVVELDSAKNGVVVGDGLKYNDGSEVRYSSGTSSSGSLKGSQNSSDPVGVHSLTPNSMMYIARTAKGQTYQFTLPDGTKVWLNADSKVEFPSNFVNSKIRNVKLTGEGYFEVAKDKEHPFVVDTRRQKVEVLGTHFNLTAYANDIEVKTTLLEGRVAVTGEGSRLMLSPGEQAYSGLDGLKAKTLVDPEAEVDWKNGEFVFDNEELGSIMKKIARWYDVSLVYEPGVDRHQTFGGKVSRSKNVSAILNSMQSTGRVKFRISEQKIIYILK